MTNVLLFRTILFGTPDFGAGATALAILLLVWLGVIVVALVGFIRGLRLVKRATRADRRKGVLLLLVSAAVLLLLVRAAIPLEDPSPRVEKGMSADEVRATLGAPFSVEEWGDRKHWYYHRGLFGIGWLCVDFGPDNLVEGTHGD